VIETNDGVSSFSSVDEDMVWEEFLEHIEIFDTWEAFS